MNKKTTLPREEFEIEGSSNFNHLTFYLKTDKPEKVGDLAVRFNSGAIYLYFNIKRSWIDEILAAESRGKKLRELIITNKDIKYTCIKKKD